MSRIDDIVNQSDERDIHSAIDKYDNKPNHNIKHDDEILSVALEESFHDPRNNPKDDNKPMNLNLDLDSDDTPDNFLKNNQTIKLNNADVNNKHSDIQNKINLWDQNDLKLKWDQYDRVLDSNKSEATVQLTTEFQHKSRPTKKLKTTMLEQLDIISENKDNYVDLTKNVKKDFRADDTNIQHRNQEPKYIDTPLSRSEFNMPFNKPESEMINNFDSKYVEQHSTRILFDDNAENTPKPELTREIDDGENITIKSTKQKQVSPKKIAKMKAKQLRSEQYKKVPKFFRFEYKTSIVCFWLSSIFLLAGFSLLTYIAVASSMGTLDYWLLLPTGVCILVFGCLFTKSALDYNYLHKDLRNSNFLVDESTPMTSIRKMYKKLIGANISLNWISAAVYVVSGLGVLLTYVVTYFMNLTALEYNDFTRLVIGSNNYLPVIFVWVFVGISCLALLIQITFNIINRKRRNDIELFYKNPIFDELEVSKIKKNANIKGAIIFSFSVFVVGFIVLMVYFILKRKKSRIL